LATQAYLETMKSAAKSVGDLSTVQANLGQSAEVLAGSYQSTAKIVAESGAKFSEALTKTVSGFIDTIKSTGENLVKSYQAIGESMSQQVNKIASDGQEYTEGLAEANQKLGCVNSAYDLHLASIRAQVSVAQELAHSLVEVSKHLSQTV